MTSWLTAWGQIVTQGSMPATDMGSGGAMGMTIHHRGDAAHGDAAHGDVRVAHYGRLQERSLTKLGQRLRAADTRPA